jgi:hypothetical protein
MNRRRRRRRKSRGQTNDDYISVKNESLEKEKER